MYSSSCPLILPTLLLFDSIPLVASSVDIGCHLPPEEPLSGGHFKALVNLEPTIRSSWLLPSLSHNNNLLLLDSFSTIHPQPINLVPVDPVSPEALVSCSLSRAQ
ncbi:hypothetical protein EI94DRAFT_1755604, partial [Lactarius quietus]